MSIYTRLASGSRSTRQLGKMVEYILNEEKTSPLFCHGIGLSVEHAVDDMMFLKQIYLKTDGRQYLHQVLSFDKEVDVLTADIIGKEILNLYEGKYQVVMALHTNTKNLHIHFLINSVSIGGRKFSESKRDMLKMRELINCILKQHGLNPVGKIEEKCDDRPYECDLSDQRVKRMDKAAFNDFAEWIFEKEDDFQFFLRNIDDSGSFFNKDRQRKIDYETFKSIFEPPYDISDQERQSAEQQIDEMNKLEGKTFFDKFRRNDL